MFLCLLYFYSIQKSDENPQEEEWEVEDKRGGFLLTRRIQNLLKRKSNLVKSVPSEIRLLGIFVIAIFEKKVTNDCLVEDVV